MHGLMVIYKFPGTVNSSFAHPAFKVFAGRARLFRPPSFLNYRINEYYLHVFSVYLLGTNNEIHSYFIMSYTFRELWLFEKYAKSLV